MTSKLNLPDFKAILTKLPLPFYAIIGAGVLSALCLYVLINFLQPHLQKQKGEEVAYPRYREVASQSKPEILKETVSALSGQWMAEKDNTVFLVMFFPNATFSWQIFEKERPTYTLYAGGSYVSGQKIGDILLSTQLEKGILIPGYRPYYRINYMQLGEQLFEWRIVRGALILTPKERSQFPENVKSMWDSFSAKGPLAFRPVVGAEKSR